MHEQWIFTDRQKPRWLLKAVSDQVWRRKKEVRTVSTGKKKIGLSVTSTHAASLNRTHCIMTLYLCAKILQLKQNCADHKTERFCHASSYTKDQPLYNIDHDSVLLKHDKCSEVVMGFISFQSKQSQWKWGKRKKSFGRKSQFDKEKTSVCALSLIIWFKCFQTLDK